MQSKFKTWRSTMADLIAQGGRRHQRWRKRLPVDRCITIGRKASAWSVAWDDSVSREHVTVQLVDSELHVHVVEGSKNPVYFQGTKVKQCRLRSGEHFVIGQTSFILADEEASLAPQVRFPATEQTFSPDYLRRHQFRDPDRRIDLLSRLPERLAAKQEDELYQQIVRVLLEGISQADAAALVQAHPDEESPVVVLHWDWSDGNTAERSMGVSQRLILEALAAQESVVHTWGADDQQFTEGKNTAWAFCTPILSTNSEDWGLYVMGSHDEQSSKSPRDPSDIRDEMKFAEVVASTVSSFREVKQLQQQQASFRQFFSPPVIAALGDGNPEQILAPREVDVTVLFCDLRGFSMESERSADDLFGLLERVSDALGILTKHILHEGGVVGDFHGDSAMGFWGWPLSQPDTAARAARAGLAIRKEFLAVARNADHALNNFRIGVGIASGRAVAGKIGTLDQVKVTAFGPAVNLASRLEGMTKTLCASILVDQTTAATLACTEADLRIRRLAVVRPYGLVSPIEIYEVLPTEEDYPLLTDEHILCYERALDAFLNKDWATAWEQLHHVPAADPSKDFLTLYIASRNRTVPKDWDGVIHLDSK